VATPLATLSAESLRVACRSCASSSSIWAAAWQPARDTRFYAPVRAGLCKIGKVILLLPYCCHEVSAP
jgi:hypothetical protein